MTLKAAFAGLDEKLQDFRRALDDLLWAVVQGQPEAKQGHALVDRYDTTTTDLLGLIEEAVAAVKEGRQSREDQIDPAGARRALIICQERFNRLSHSYYSELVSPEAMEALNSLVQEDGKEWWQWVNGVKDGLEWCRQPLYDVNQALFQCWQELTEGPGLVSVSVNASSMGQQISLARESPGEGYISD
jgi:hypothetical protein